VLTQSFAPQPVNRFTCSPCIWLAAYTNTPDRCHVQNAVTCTACLVHVTCTMSAVGHCAAAAGVCSAAGPQADHNWTTTSVVELQHAAGVLSAGGCWGCCIAQQLWMLLHLTMQLVASRSNNTTEHLHAKCCCTLQPTATAASLYHAQPLAACM
jgi:hypothetical protein